VSAAGGVLVFPDLVTQELSRMRARLDIDLIAADALPLLRASCVLGALLALNGLAPGLEAQQARGRVTCEITENGESASGTASFQRDGSEVAAGTCGKELSVPSGDYSVVLQLDGALDGPAQRQSLTVQANGKHTLKADFATGTLEVRIVSQGKRAAGMAIIKRDGQQIGTLGSGVAAHLSAGSYRVVARYRAQEKDLGDVAIGAGQRVTLDAAFD
jgi:hypothetical protein